MMRTSGSALGVTFTRCETPDAKLERARSATEDTASTSVRCRRMHKRAQQTAGARLCTRGGEGVLLLVVDLNATAAQVRRRARGVGVTELVVVHHRTREVSDLHAERVRFLRAAVVVAVDRGDHE